MKSLEDRWNQLQPDAQKPVFQLVDALHPLAFYMGRAPNGDRLLLLVTPEQPVLGRSFRAVRIDAFAREDGRWSLLIALQSQELVHVFALLCNDLVEAGRHVPHPEKSLDFILRRLALWQRLLERGGSEVLAPSAIRGLAAELVFLHETLIPSMGAVTAVEAWVGPFGAPQDFQTPTFAWEVKSVHGDSDNVQVSSEDQLWSATRSLQLVVVCIEDAADGDGGGFSLNSLVIRIKEAITGNAEALEAFETRLVEAGFVRRPEYDRPLFRIPWIKTFKVEPGFPRVAKPELPIGVSAVRYELALSACLPYLEEPSAIKR